MFTGIIEDIGNVVALEREKNNLHLTLSCNFTPELKIDQSVAHNGVCLTIVNIENNNYTVTAIEETLNRTNLSELIIGSEVNLERCTKVGGRLDGHIVQGHIDQTAICTQVEELAGSWKYHFEYEKSNNITVEKGSVTINGVSLTIVDSEINTFSVAIIPFTHEHTNFHTFKKGTKVNLEFDIVGKYVMKMQKMPPPSYTQTE